MNDESLEEVVSLVNCLVCAVEPVRVSEPQLADCFSRVSMTFIR